jgi:lipase
VTVHRFGAGPRKVLALHCSLAHGRVWDGLDLPGCTIVAPDLLGHGAQPLWDGTGDYHTECTRDVIALAEGEGPMDVIGHSSGATVALRMMLERPDLVRSLVLIEPVLFAAARAAGDAAYGDYVRDFSPFGAAMAAHDAGAATTFFHQFWSGTDFASLPDRLQAYMTARIDLIREQMGVMLQDAAGFLGHMRLESMGVPVLLVEGATSHPVMAAIQAELARRLPRVRRVVVDGAGHMSPMTHKAEVLAMVGGFYGTSSMM